jgi:galactokinase
MPSLNGVSETFVASAPGRVNLIGEHTDYNGGFVLPSAIPQRTEVTLTPRADLRVFAESANITAGSCTASGMGSGTPSRAEYVLGQETRSGRWWDYVQGVTTELLKIPRLAQKIRGFELKITSRVPLGSGLSSSAALEVALLRGIRKAFAISETDLSDILIAQIGQRAENEFVGARVGIMDQMAASLADERSALFLDTRSLEYRKALLPEDTELAVINSGIAHRHSGGDYNTRRAECEAACRALDIKELRALEVPDLAGLRFRALSPLLQKRARHVVTENQRVLDAVEAMNARDPEKLGELFRESHLSMRDDYEVSIPEIDQLVEIAHQQPGVYGARLTGGGFGGSIVILCQKGKAASIAAQITSLYRGTATTLVPEI